MNDDFMNKFKSVKLPNVQAEYLADDFSTMQRDVDATIAAMACHVSAKDEALFRTAAASEAQTELLDNQLQEVKTQNDLLRDNCTILKELNNKLKEEAADSKATAEESRKEALKSRKREKVAIWVAIVSPAVSIVASVLIALFF